VAVSVILREIFSPFYLFQYFAMAIWLYTMYYYYCFTVMFITICSVIYTVRGKLYNMKRLRELAGTSSVVKNYYGDPINGESLVPGDSFLITEGMDIPADSILIKGRIVVDESILTGESVPVTKTFFKPSKSDRDATKRTVNILYGGTTVKCVHTGGEAVGMVYRTGFRTARGQIIHTLIEPKVSKCACWCFFWSCPMRMEIVDLS
jgi:cation-transporting ATPase 13A3/4/5